MRPSEEHSQEPKIIKPETALSAGDRFNQQLIRKEHGNQQLKEMLEKIMKLRKKIVNQRSAIYANEEKRLELEFKIADLTDRVKSMKQVHQLITELLKPTDMSSISNESTNLGQMAYVDDVYGNQKSHILANMEMRSGLAKQLREFHDEEYKKVSSQKREPLDCFQRYDDSLAELKNALCANLDNSREHNILQERMELGRELQKHLDELEPDLKELSRGHVKRIQKLASKFDSHREKELSAYFKDIADIHGGINAVLNKKEVPIRDVFSVAHELTKTVLTTAEQLQHYLFEKSEEKNNAITDTKRMLHKAEGDEGKLVQTYIGFYQEFEALGRRVSEFLLPPQHSIQPQEKAPPQKQSGQHQKVLDELRRQRMFKPTPPVTRRTEAVSQDELAGLQQQLEQQRSHNR